MKANQKILTFCLAFLALALSSMQAGAREAARRASCVNNLNPVTVTFKVAPVDYEQPEECGSVPKFPIYNPLSYDPTSIDPRSYVCPSDSDIFGAKGEVPSYFDWRTRAADFAPGVTQDDTLSVWDLMPDHDMFGGDDEETDADDDWRTVATGDLIVDGAEYGDDDVRIIKPPKRKWHGGMKIVPVPQPSPSPSPSPSP